MPKPVVEEHEKTLDQRFDEFAKETAGSFTQIVTTLLDIQSALPSPPHLKLNIANCCQCGRIVDTREKIDGGDDWGHQLSDKRWVCSPECLDAASGIEPETNLKNESVPEIHLESKADVQSDFAARPQRWKGVRVMGMTASKAVSLVDELRATTEQMACTCSVPMELWQRHSTAALASADALEAQARELTAARAEIERLKGLIVWAYDTLTEINVSNYDHDDVCTLNEASVEVILGIKADALAKEEAGR